MRTLFCVDRSDCPGGSYVPKILEGHRMVEGLGVSQEWLKMAL
jgi:hypothetical protein